MILFLQPRKVLGETLQSVTTRQLNGWVIKMLIRLDISSPQPSCRQHWQKLHYPYLVLPGGAVSSTFSPSHMQMKSSVGLSAQSRGENHKVNYISTLHTWMALGDSGLVVIMDPSEIVGWHGRGLKMATLPLRLFLECYSYRRPSCC